MVLLRYIGHTKLFFDFHSFKNLLFHSLITICLCQSVLNYSLVPDPTVFCWTDCYDDQLPDKFHFDRELWIENRYSQKELGEHCKIVNCTAVSAAVRPPQ